MTNEAKRSDYGTDEIHERQETKAELTGRGHAVRFRVQDGTELDRLFNKGVIDQFEKSAGESLSRDLHRSHMLGMKTVNFMSAGGRGGEISETHANALARVSDAITHMDRTVGVAARSLTVNACLSLVKVQGFDATSALRRGLASLLELYEPRHRA